jgi:LacI family transcriptional regulator
MAATKPTIYDVAKRAGVGVATVSRVLNNSPQVRPQTRQTVQHAIDSLAYRPSSAARQLSKQTRARTIGVITQPYIYYHSFSERLRGIQKTLQSLDNPYELVLYSVSSLEQYAHRLTTIVQTGSIEGLIIIDLDFDEQKAKLLRDANLPFVGINHWQDRDWPCIHTDNVEGGYLATSHLISSGHERIAYLGDAFVDPYAFHTSAERHRGYLKAMAEASLEARAEYAKYGRHDYGVAKDLAAELLALSPRPTAIFAMSDTQALACIAAARDAGLSVPADLSVIGYDDLDTSMHAGLTTVRQHLELSGQHGVEWLLTLLEGRETPPLPLPPLEVVVRYTTDAPPG